MGAYCGDEHRKSGVYRSAAAAIKKYPKRSQKFELNKDYYKIKVRPDVAADYAKSHIFKIKSVYTDVTKIKIVYG